MTTSLKGVLDELTKKKVFTTISYLSPSLTVTGAGALSIHWVPRKGVKRSTTTVDLLPHEFYEVGEGMG